MILAVALLLLAAIFVIFRDPKPDTLPFSNPFSPDTVGGKADIWPETILSNSETRQYNREGRLQYTLNSKKMRFFKSTPAEQQEFIDYQRPSLELYDDGVKNTPDTPVLEATIEAEAGWSDSEGEHIRLRGEVVVTQYLANGNQNRLSTEALDIWPGRQFASSDKAVIISGVEGNTHATGLKVWFKDRKIELLSAVRGLYVAPR